MALPAPNLDDRRFQDLVDDAKRMVQQRCPEWSDHNVSDPGVTLIETFAYMVDQLLYRLNRVPDRLYVKFLDLIGLQLHPPNDARADVTFWLSAPQDQVLTIPANTEIATPRTPTEEAVPFVTVADLPIIPCSLERLAREPAGAREIVDMTDALDAAQRVDAFSASPQAGDALYFGLSEAVPAGAVALRLSCEIEGMGVDPTNPPVRWEAWDGDRWVGCEVDHDETGGLNRAGDVVLHVPPTHKVSVLVRQRAGWLRCVVTPPEEDQPFYSATPKITRAQAFTVGGTTEAVNGERVEHDVLGRSSDAAGQIFELTHRPVVPSEEVPVVEVSTPEGWEEWSLVESFADSGADDHHFAFDFWSGQVQFGPALRERDGSLRRFGAVPALGATIRMRSYRYGGGQRGNVARGAISILKSSVPYVNRVENRSPAGGGVDAESLDDARVRGPIALRTGNRAVTAEDYEYLAKAATSEVARVRCVPADKSDDGAVRVLIVPAAIDDALGRLRIEQLIPSNESLERVCRYLDERRCIGARLSVEPPVYQGVTVVARIRALPRTNATRLRDQALEALYRYFHPIRGGPGDNGWPFGRPVLVGEVYAVLQQLPDTELVEDVRLFGADPITGERGEAATRIDLEPNALVFSYSHQVMVEES